MNRRGDPTKSVSLCQQQGSPNRATYCGEDPTNRVVHESEAPGLSLRQPITSSFFLFSRHPLILLSSPRWLLLCALLPLHYTHTVPATTALLLLLLPHFCCSPGILLHCLGFFLPPSRPSTYFSFSLLFSSFAPKIFFFQ